MTSTTITNEMLYELIKGLESKTDNRFEQAEKHRETIYESFKDFKNDTNHRFEQIDHHFEQIDKRFEQNDKRSDNIESKLNRIEDIQRENQKTLGELWQTRKDMTINFSKAFAGANAFISAVIAVIVSLFIKKS